MLHLNGFLGHPSTWLLLLTIWLSLSALAALVEVVGREDGGARIQGTRERIVTSRCRGLRRIHND